jgi:hypothetical protein
VRAHFIEPPRISALAIRPDRRRSIDTLATPQGPSRLTEIASCLWTPPTRHGAG